MQDDSNTNSTDQTQTDATATTTADTSATNSTQTADDLSTLFTPEEVAAKKESVTAGKAEEARRAALTDEERTAEDTAKESEAKANEVPEEYQFTMPEGMELDKETLEAVAPVFKAMGLHQANADKLVQVYAEKILPAFAKRQQDAWQAETDSWKVAASKDPEIGGTKFDKSVADALRAVNTINPALKPVFDQYRLGNHPEFIRAFAKISTLLSEDTMMQNRQNNTAPKSIAERMFPGLPVT